MALHYTVLCGHHALLGGRDEYRRARSLYSQNLYSSRSTKYGIVGRAFRPVPASGSILLCCFELSDM